MIDAPARPSAGRTPLTRTQSRDNRQPRRAKRREQPTELAVVRHGQTEFNVRGLYQGHVDSPLTDAGVAQAHLLGIQNHGAIEETIHERLRQGSGGCVDWGDSGWRWHSIGN
ncbi:MAG: histidine phosphatase family protein [Gammaproteobacteria bacterium]|nr:histidine phosphatase family protein [Gammaproteobacteria bacterium]MDE0269762.1 histidine phosphatase family protein [Gammaproteobacteria bacterium]